MKLRIGQVRAVPTKGDLATNQIALTDILARVASPGVDVVVTPECFLDGYVATEESVSAEGLRAYAVDPESSGFVREIQAWSRREGAWLILGCTRLAPGGIFNSALVIDRTGALVGAYDKTHCQTHDRKFSAGSTLPIFESDFGRFGVLICADRRWPETVRTLALRGARIIFNPTYGMHGELNLCMMRTRSYESEIPIAFTHPLQSLVTGPRGEILRDERVPQTALCVTEVDLAEVETVRTGPSAHLRDRRADLYSP